LKVAPANNPGQHGIFGFHRALRGGLDTLPVAPEDVRRPRVWEIAARHGRRSIVLNAPLTYPPRDDVGLMVSGFLTPPGAADFVAPAGHGAELARAVPGYRVDVDAELVRRGRLAAFRDDAVAVQGLHADAATALLGHDDWDLAWFTFHVLDTVQHFFWRFMDRTHPAWPGPGAFQHVVRDSYVALDRTLARLVAGCGGDTTVVLASAYGAAPLHRYFCLLGWLRDEGVLAALSRWAWGSIGACEMLCGVLLVAPLALRWLPNLTPLAAAALAIESTALALLYARYSLQLDATNPMVWVVLMAVMAAFVAFGRFAR
jgi:predicted AlkP superfamily phosphohydrolase/phosphomutase